MWSFLQKIDLYDRLLDHLINALKHSEVELIFEHIETIMNPAVQLVAEDLEAYALRDPAAGGRGDLIFDAYASFKAVLYYRLAHQVWLLPHDLNGMRAIIAHKLTNKGKICSGAEIHPAVKVGRRFVLDHAYGTVIGETCEIGDDCYILSGVTLGASGIANNPVGKRHPKLGNNVEVGAGVRVLGPVTIGDNVFISPSCVVTQDIPANSKVSIVNQVQTQRLADGGKGAGFYSAFASGGRLYLVGEKLEFSALSVVDANHRKVFGVELTCIARSNNHMEFRLDRAVAMHAAVPDFPLNLHLSCPLQEVTLLNPPGLDGLARQVLGTAGKPQRLLMQGKG